MRGMFYIFSYREKHCRLNTCFALVSRPFHTHSHRKLHYSTYNKQSHTVYYIPPACHILPTIPHLGVHLSIIHPSIIHSLIIHPPTIHPPSVPSSSKHVSIIHSLTYISIHPSSIIIYPSIPSSSLIQPSTTHY